jgi:hypothetical protein
LIPRLRIAAAAAEERRDGDELSHDARMPDRHLQRNRSAVAETEKVGVVNVQVFQERRGVVG